jgi:hypothetical protein
VGDDRRQADLQALDAPTSAPHAAGAGSGHDRAAVRAAGGVVDDEPVTDVDDDGHRRVRDGVQVERLRSTVAEPGHAHAGQR